MSNYDLDELERQRDKERFEDGTKVESVGNRLLTFPANMKHMGTSCTDQQFRIVINFNYYSKYST